MITHQVLKVKEVAEVLGYTPATVYKLLANGRIRHVKNPGRNGGIRITRAALDEYLAEIEPADDAEDMFSPVAA